MKHPTFQSCHCYDGLVGRGEKSSPQTMRSLLKRVFIGVLEIFHTVEETNSALYFILLEETLFDIASQRLPPDLKMISWGVLGCYHFSIFRVTNVGVPNTDKYVLH